MALVITVTVKDLLLINEIIQPGQRAHIKGGIVKIIKLIKQVAEQYSLQYRRGGLNQ